MKVKKKQKLNSAKKVSQPVGINNEITGILMLAFGILALLSYYFVNSIGPFGRFVRNLLLGFLGAPSFIIPPAIVVMSVFVLLRKNDNVFNKRMIFSSILVLVFSAMIHAGGYRAENYVNLNPFQCIREFYIDGISLDGGGVFGGIIAAPFLKIFNVLGTVIILTTLAIIDIIILTNISVGNILKGFRKQARRLKKGISGIKPATAAVLGSEENEGPEIVGEGENLNLEFKPGRKVIDFKIEKTARDLKEKTDFGVISRKLDNFEAENNEEPIKFIMKDLKTSKPAPKEKIEDNVPVDINITARSGEGYIYPSAALLKEPSENGLDAKSLKNSAIEGAMKLEETLTSFGVDAKVINVSRGPSVTRYELRPGVGVQVKKIANLADDIALHLASAGVRIEAPIPGKDAVGIEVPNKEVNAVLLREVIESEEFSKNPSKLAFALGRDISGDIVVADIAKMPHVLIAGATGAGKSVCINNLILSLIYKASPDEVKLILVDPKVVELGIYNGIPHLMLPVVTDPKKAAGALNWAVQEMLNRYNLFSARGVKDIKGYNRLVEENDEPKMPQIVIIIDELADLMMAAPNDVEDAICRLAQMARAAGMHLVIATQRPSVDVITGIIKANIPSRISFAVTSQVDSRTILDMAGAEKLLGRGDMLFYPSGKPKPIRVQGAFHIESEIEKVVAFIKDQGNVEYDSDLIEKINNENQPVESIPGDNDELLPQAIEMVVDAEMASVSLIQRKFKVGYARAARIVDQMEARGIVGPHEGSKPRQVLISRLQWQEMQMTNEN